MTNRIFATRPLFARRAPVLLLRATSAATLLFLVTACGGGGGGGGGSSGSSTPPKPATGSMLIVDVDSNDNGLIEIANLEQLDWIRNDLNGTSLTDNTGQSNSKGCPGTCFGYELVADLNFDTNGDGVMDSRDTYFDPEGKGGHAGWRPIGGYPGFAAVFDGNNHTIHNLYINRPNEGSVGLFGYVSALGLRNVKLEGPLMSVIGGQNVGSLAGSVQLVSDHAQYALMNCHSAGKVAGTYYAGGLVGLLYNSAEAATVSITGNTSSADVSASDVVAVRVAAGGLIGQVGSYGQSQMQLDNNSATGTVGAVVGGGLLGGISTSGTSSVSLSNAIATGQVSGAVSTGGLVGSVVIPGATDIVKIQGSHASGAAAGSGSTGGLIGSVFNEGTLRVEQSYAVGDVQSEDSGNAGGLIGYLGGNGMEASASFYIDASYATGAVTAVPSVTYITAAGGLVGVARENSLHVSNSFASGDINGNTEVGGLIGYIHDGDAPIVAVIENSFASGAVSGVRGIGGIVGEITVLQPSSFSMVNTLVLGKISVGDPFFNPFLQAMIGIIWNGPDLATRDIRGNYFALDTTNQTSGTPVFVVTDEMTGAWLAELQCPIAPNNLTCSSDELYHGWDKTAAGASSAAWNFGGTAQLPGLRIGDLVYRPTYENGAYVVAVEAL